MIFNKRLHNLPATLLMGWAALTVTALGSDGPEPAHPAIPEVVGQPRDFAAGVRIDWERRVVEVDAVVVLREGMLELLACSPQTREHESILSVKAQPMHIYQAMGLIGLEPGSPVRYDPKLQRVHPPTGEALNLRIRYRERESVKTVPARRWLVDVERDQPPNRINWVFAGSRIFEDGRYGADADGTIICVVDFDTALITVGSSHSASDALLWLSANKSTIPPIGTECTLLISSAAGRVVTLKVEVHPDGSLQREGKPISAAGVVRLLHREEPGVSAVAIQLRAVAGTPAKIVDAAVETLVKAGIGRGLIKVTRGEQKPEGATMPKSPGG